MTSARRMAIFSATVASVVVVAAAPAAARDSRRPVDCVAAVDSAALAAMGQTSAHGQMRTFGDPVAFGPYLRRVEVDVFGDGDYDVDVTIDRACKVLSVTTVRATNGPP